MNVSIHTTFRYITVVISFMLLGFPLVCYTQHTTITEFKIILLKVDSIVKNSITINYDTKDIQGQIDSSLGEINGVVFLVPRTHEIKQIKILAVLSAIELDFYFVNSEVLLILSEGLIYYKEGEKAYTFSDKNLELTKKELQSYFDFYKAVKVIF